MSQDGILPALSKTITVAIPTIGRFEEVRDTIEGILAGTRLPDEILVSDQNVPSREDLDAYLATRSPLIRHLRTAPKGVVFNMNTLLCESRSDIILYVDDDVIPSPEFVEAHLRNYETYGDIPSAVGIAGRVEQPTGDLPAEQVTKVGAFFPLSGRMIFRFNGLIRQECVFAQGANMSFDRTSLVSIGGFDEGFTGNGYFFESDATLRLARAFPGRFYFDPKATLRHLAAPRGGARVADRSLHHSYFVFNGLRLFRRHSPSAVLPFIILRLASLTLAKAVFRLSLPLLTRGFRALVRGCCQSMDRKGLCV